MMPVHSYDSMLILYALICRQVADTNLFKCLRHVMVPCSGILACDLDVDVFHSFSVSTEAKNVTDVHLSKHGNSLF